eukprot:Gb_32790 [translate_table: standard]
MFGEDELSEDEDQGSRRYKRGKRPKSNTKTESLLKERETVNMERGENKYTCWNRRRMRSFDIMKWVELCPSEQDLGNALMRLVVSGRDIPHACEFELLILAHSSACLDAIARLPTLVAIRGIWVIVLLTLKHFNMDKRDAFAIVYNHFDTKSKISALLESRGHRTLDQWLLRHDREYNAEDLRAECWRIATTECWRIVAEVQILLLTIKQIVKIIAECHRGSNLGRR